MGDQQRQHGTTAPRNNLLDIITIDAEDDEGEDENGNWNEPVVPYLREAPNALPEVPSAEPQAFRTLLLPTSPYLIWALSTLPCPHHQS
ncbi:hypothetical protein CC2G_002362 [Coprinopsis cinerea AmutBmut pab1-1]|nr:hypothetical protein CC2G_002362 [Coprinopsis cinerea AmutBmut pab1-1]